MVINKSYYQKMCSASASSSTSNSAASTSSSSAAMLEQQRRRQLCSESASGSGSSSPATEMASYPLIPREQLEVQQQLGVGTYGSVFKGLWERPDGHSLPVALKKVFMLEKEVDILSQIRHRNIIQFYGVSQANPDFFIVTEYAENGSLYEHLHNKNEQISLERIIKWAMQIARGVAYLHNEAPITVIHRDLKSKNVVIGKKFQCKLCDFGTSKDLTHSWTAPSWGGTAAWMSPEIISQHEGITTSTDVWSFAVVLWEMFSRQVPYQGLTEFKIYSIISQHGVRLVIPDTCPEPLAKLLKSCWSQNPKERPDMKCVLGALERMGRDKDLREECAHFLDQNKEEWRARINEQLLELDALKLDLARQMEDLKRREQALRKRENSHRNFLHMVDILNVENVCEWNEDCVCEWVQNVAAAAVADFPEETVDKIISCVLQYGINGPRLLKITEKDLESLGIEPVALRRYITLKMDELRAMNVQLCNFPCCPPVDDGNATPPPPSTEKPIDCSIVLHVGLYSRMVLPGPAYRFKVFLDSDWETSMSGGSEAVKQQQQPPTELLDSSTVIKEVTITMNAADQSELIGPVHCICPPFGYLEWAQVSREEQKQKMPLTLTLQVNYTDQVIQPRNTRIQIRLDDLSSGPRTLCNRRVPLKLCPTPTDTSLSRISSSMQKNNTLRSPPAIFRSRRRSLGLSGSISPDRQPLMASSSSNLLNRSPVWADLAASIRNSTCSTFRPVSKSIEQQRHRPRHSISEEGNGSSQLQLEQQQQGQEQREGQQQPAAAAATAMDSVQTARQKALARVRRKQQMAAAGGRKKCLSETWTNPNASSISLLASPHPHAAGFFVSTPNSSPSTSSGATDSSSLSPRSRHSQSPISAVENEKAEKAEEEKQQQQQKPQEQQQRTAQKVVPLPVGQPVEKKVADKWALQQRKCRGGSGAGLSLVVPATDKLLRMAEKPPKLEAALHHLNNQQQPREEIAG